MSQTHQTTASTAQVTPHAAALSADHTADIDLDLDPTISPDLDPHLDPHRRLLTIETNTLFGVSGYGMATVIKAMYRNATAESRVMVGRDPAVMISLLSQAMALVHETRSHGTADVPAAKGVKLAEKLWKLLLSGEELSLDAKRLEEDIRMKVGHVHGVAEHRIESIKEHRRVPLEWFGNGERETTEQRYAAVLRDFDTCFEAICEVVSDYASKMNESCWYPFVKTAHLELADICTREFHAGVETRSQQRAADAARAYGSTTLTADLTD